MRFRILTPSRFAKLGLSGQMVLLDASPTCEENVKRVQCADVRLVLRCRGRSAPATGLSASHCRSLLVICVFRRDCGGQLQSEAC